MKKFLIGCGIAAGIIILLGILSVVAMVSFVKRNAPDVDHLKDVSKTLEQTYPTRETYVPPLDGTLDPQRIESFAAIREAFMAQTGGFAQNMGEMLANVDASRDSTGQKSFGQKLRFGLKMARSGMALARTGVRAVTVRDSLLLDAKMGEGEYLYLYCLSSFSDLGWQPMEQPGLKDYEAMPRLKLREFEELVDKFERECRRTMISMAEAQRDTLEAQTARAPAANAELERIRAELVACRQDHGRFPWSGALTPAQQAALAPYRDRLRAALPANSNALLLDAALVTGEFKAHNGGFQFQTREDRRGDD